MITSRERFWHAARRASLLSIVLGATAVQAAYDGYGSVTRGAEDCQGYETYRVDSLADAGPGSFRDAVSVGCRKVVFDVAGTINLRSDLLVAVSFLTVDGASAPPPGITLAAPQIRTAIEPRNSPGPAHDIIIQNLRITGTGQPRESADIWELDGSAHAVYHVILDHLTATGSSDGNFDIYAEVRDVTISNNLVVDSIQGGHFSRETPPNRERITMARNVYARNNERQLRMRYDNRSIDIVNNVVYGWGWFEGGAAGLDLPSDPGYRPSINVEGNVYHFVPGLSGNADEAVILDPSAFPGDIYFSGNILPRGEDDAQSTAARTPTPGYAQVAPIGASSLGDATVTCAGTHFPTRTESDLLAEISLAIGGSGSPCAGHDGH